MNDRLKQENRNESSRVGGSVMKKEVPQLVGSGYRPEPLSKISKRKKKEILSLWEGIQKKRAELGKMKGNKKKNDCQKELFSQIEVLDEKLADWKKSIYSYPEEIEKLEEQIKKIKESLEVSKEEYENSYRLMKRVLEYEKVSSEENLKTEEELDERRQVLAEEKLQINENSVEIKKKIDLLQKKLRICNRRKKKLEKEIEKADNLQIPVLKYQEIMDALRKPTIFNAILEKKGLLTKKSVKEREQEEIITKEYYSSLKEEVVKEIAALEKENEALTAEDAIEALYSLEVSYRKNKSPRILMIKSKRVERLEEKTNSLPQKIVGRKKAKDYIPKPAPEDMTTKEKKNPEKIIVYRDSKTNQFYARKHIFERFGFKESPEEIRLTNDGVFKPIFVDDVLKIVQNEENKYSPYSLEIEDISLDEERKRGAKDIINFYYHPKMKEEVYVDKITLKRFGIFPIDIKKFHDTFYYRIRPQDMEKVENHSNQDIEVQYREFSEMGSEPIKEKLDLDNLSEEELEELLSAFTETEKAVKKIETKEEKSTKK